MISTEVAKKILNLKIDNSNGLNCIKKPLKISINNLP
jgi:hypothetical protein